MKPSAVYKYIFGPLFFLCVFLNFSSALCSETLPLFFPNPGPSRLSPRSLELETAEVSQSKTLGNSEKKENTKVGEENRAFSSKMAASLVTGFQVIPLKNGHLQQELSSLDINYSSNLDICEPSVGFSLHSANPFPHALGHRSKLIWPQFHLGIKKDFDSLFLNTHLTGVGPGNLRSRGVKGGWSLGVGTLSTWPIDIKALFRWDFLSKSWWFAGENTQGSSVLIGQSRLVTGLQASSHGQVASLKWKASVVGLYQEEPNALQGRKGEVAIYLPSLSGGVDVGILWQWGNTFWEATVSKGCSSHSFSPLPTAALCHSSSTSFAIKCKSVFD